MGEKEMNRRMGCSSCTGCGSKTRTTGTAMPRSYRSAAMNQQRGGAFGGCQGRNDRGGNTGCMTGCGMNYGRMRNTCDVKERAAVEADGCCDMKEKLRKLEFAIVDVALYLNAYPESDCALAYYHKLIEERDCLYKQISETCGPMTLYDNRSKTAWKWADGPWPWHTDSN